MTISRSTSRARLSSSSPWTSSFCTIVGNKLALVKAECQTPLTDFEMNGFRKANGKYHQAGRAALPIAVSAALLLSTAIGSPLAAVTAHRVAALIDRPGLPVSEVSPRWGRHFFPRAARRPGKEY